MEAAEMIYPVGIETFSKIREYGFAYVDKTEYVRQMTRVPGFYFISRPRRFGKSLFVSTLEAYFQGRRDLFKGLAIDRDDVDWEPRPVFRFTFNDLDMSRLEYVTLGIGLQFHNFELEYGIDNGHMPLPQRFSELLRVAYEQTGRKAAVLFDEYDSMLLATLDEEKQELNSQYRELLKSIFTVLKSFDRYIYFAFITGVSRFSHTSLFSGANNIPDCSMQDRFAGICGITEEEMLKTLSPGIQTFADRHGISFERAVETLKENYDGYHFTKNCPDIYNPYSLIRTLDSGEIDDYWFGVGTPGYLIKILKRDDFFLPDLDCLTAEPNELTAKESYLRHPMSLMYESGYLTIKEYHKEEDNFTLGIPNKEVEKGLANALLPAYSSVKESAINSFVVKMRRAVVRGEADTFMELVQTFLEGNPYSNTEKKKRETYFKNNMYLIFRIIGFSARTEEETCRARTDLVLKTKRYIYIFELKVDGTPEEAMEQIEANGYALPYRHDGRTIIKIGANYSNETNNIDRWTVK